MQNVQNNMQNLLLQRMVTNTECIICHENSQVICRLSCIHVFHRRRSASRNRTCHCCGGWFIITRFKSENWLEDGLSKSLEDSDKGQEEAEIEDHKWEHDGFETEILEARSNGGSGQKADEPS